MAAAAPDEPAGARGECEHLAGVVADIDPSVGERGRGLDRRAGGEAPAQASGAGVEGIDVSALVGHVEDAARHQRRRLRGADRPAPADMARLRGERQKLAARPRRLALVVADEGGEEEMAAEGRRGPAAAVGAVVPANVAARRIDRVEPAVEGLLEHAAEAENRRELEQRPAVERPEPPERRPQSRRADRAQPGVVGAVRRPRERRVGRRRLRRLRDSRERHRRRRCQRCRLRPAAPAGDESSDRHNQAHRREAPRYRCSLR